MRAVIVLTALTALAGCSTYRDQLVRSQHAFEVNEHERALALLRDLERDMTSLSPSEQAQYCYLRGMTDYRIGYRADARHWLALARTYEDASPGVLPSDWKSRSGEALDEMNNVVYEEGLGALDKKSDEESRANGANGNRSKRDKTDRPVRKPGPTPPPTP